MEPHKISLQELADIIKASIVISTASHTGILIHIIAHPIFGKAATIQVDDGALLFRDL
ncbi:hypothetical protein [Methylobacter sp. YRD-M1]|uniref:hypothetical protein n=1 Tax=Methylobacter sp. YRD-M1 TaxID=2911520 RepID=UPI00227C93A7|nr:hypothetical protein [Methylobacter sp. YRD-M1]WAK01676.1 hypothetical protein LZ558_17875 [Methylobacter sp. YRD-M1]